MKKSVFILLVAIAYIMLPKNTSAQYKSVFGDSSTSWTVTHCYSYRDGADYTDSFYVVGDTIAFKNTYKKINKKSFNKKTYFHALMREDTSSGKVLLRHKSLIDSEYVMMNMNLQKGDSFPFYEYGEIKYYKKIIGSGKWSSGWDTLERRDFNIHLDCNDFAGSQQFSFIEGIGPTSGAAPWEAFGFYDDETQLVCYFKDRKQVFWNPVGWSSKCNYYYLSVEENSSFTYFKVYPNPIKNSGIMSFNNDERSNVSFSIYDVSGKCLYQTQCRESQIQFNTEKLTQGIYIYKLVSEDGKTAGGKLIKQ